MGSGSGNGVNPLCTSGISANNTATVTKTNNTVSAASSTPTLCISTPLTTITHTTTGATGIGTPSNLPAGVSASWSFNIITISGTPTASGTFSYSIPLTGGCGTVNATGTITVRPLFIAGAIATTGRLSVTLLYQQRADYLLHYCTNNPNRKYNSCERR